jgi:hypothetical protein
MYPYDCKITDQSRINGLVNVAQLVLGGFSNEPIAWKNSNEIQCVPWTPQQMLALGLDLKRHVEKQTDKYEAFKVYIMNDLRTKEEIENISWDTEVV